MRVKVLVIPVGIIVLLIGFVWFLQGIGVLPGSFMTDSSFWAFAGAFAIIDGLVLIAVGVTSAKPFFRNRPAK
jgi:hypothetical protein